jgi:putative acetyltransferase
MITIRPETLEDSIVIYEVNKLAFGQENEARLVENIRQAANFNSKLSLVAIKNEKVVGHLLFSPIIIQASKDDIPALALAPLAVCPEFQNQGIGSELVKRGLNDCKGLGHKVVVVIGHPNYYTRFGFSSATTKGLSAPFPVADEAFMIVELVPGTVDGISGIVNIHQYSMRFRGINRRRI